MSIQRAGRCSLRSSEIRWASTNEVASGSRTLSPTHYKDSEVTTGSQTKENPWTRRLVLLAATAQLHTPILLFRDRKVAHLEDRVDCVINPALSTCSPCLYRDHRVSQMD